MNFLTMLKVFRFGTQDAQNGSNQGGDVMSQLAI